jgi:1,4-alpha-glucan branching enzyme
MSTHHAEEPQIWNNKIFLTAAPEEKRRFVGVAFDYEDYSVIHPFEINESGIYIYSADTPEKSEIHYRLIIDGLWMADPLSRDNIKDKFGIPVSRLKIAPSTYVKVKGPLVSDSGNTNFSLRSKPDSTVSIVGTFNGWDPYMTPMQESSPGVYTTDLKLREGDYFYYFIIDGKKAMDPMNFARAMNREGEEVCRITISRS